MAPRRRRSRRSSTRGRVLVPGKSCWRSGIAHRLTFLVDGAAYFPTLESSLRQARRQILILAWDFFSRLKLLGPDDDPSEHLGIKDLLESLLHEQPNLEVHLVLWDPALIYVHEREHFPTIKLGSRTHPRFYFHLDVNFPPGAAQHQKVVVIDDAVAFIGGIDLTSRRWDTRDHRPGDPHRIEENGQEYRPFHDLQVLLDGDVARSLGDLARERIEAAASVKLHPPAAGSDPWPKGVPVDMEDVEVAIARTQSSWNEVRARADTLEVYRRAIAKARGCIFIENQHFSSYKVTRLLAERLLEPGGPEVVMVLPKFGGGWLEHGAMGTLRTRMHRILSNADLHGRLRLYYPHVEGLNPNLWIHVHSKVLVVDDELAMVGSTNLTNRSLSLDTEADVAFEARGDSRIEEGVLRLRNRLIAEHLGTTPERVAEEIVNKGSLIGAIEASRGGKRTLLPLEPQMPEIVDEIVPAGDLIDPEEPVGPKDLVAKLASVEEGRKRGGPILRTGVLLLAAVVLALVWRYTPFQEYLEPELLVAWAQPVRDSPLAPLITIAIFVLGGLLAFPVLVLILATGIAFGPVHGMLYAMLGSMLSAGVGYLVGKKVGEGALRRLAGTRIDKVSRALARRGILSMAAIRMVPLAPFTVVNMAAGASHIRLFDYLLGTFIGMAPGVFAITVFGYGIAQAIGEGEIGWLVVILMIPTMLLLLGSWIRRMKRRREGPGGPPS